MNSIFFLGLVTHKASRFPAAASASGLVNQVSVALNQLGYSTVVRVRSEDEFESSGVALTKHEILKSIHAELDLERSWRRYVDPRTSELHLSAEILARKMYRTLKFAAPWQAANESTSAGALMIRRLVNIELSHIALLKQAHNSGAAWSLIVEDDAVTDDSVRLAREIADFMSAYTSTSQPKFVNLSRSFSHSTLGIKKHLTLVGEWGDQSSILQSDRPLTNTVCAILYRGSFLNSLIPAIEQIPISPVLPIDWKLNAALLNMYRSQRLGAGDCWFTEPAPIVQASMYGLTTDKAWEDGNPNAV